MRRGTRRQRGRPGSASLRARRWCGAVEEGNEGGGAGPQGLPLLAESLPLLAESLPLLAESLHGFGMALIGSPLCFGMALIGVPLCFGVALIGGVFLRREGAVAGIGGAAHGPEAGDDEDSVDRPDEEGGGDVRGGDVLKRGHGLSPGRPVPAAVSRARG